MTDALFHLGPDEFDLWIEGRLPADRTSHLETCPSCSAEAQQTRELIQRLASLPMVSPSASMADRVMRQVIVSQAGGHLSQRRPALNGDVEQGADRCPFSRRPDHPVRPKHLDRHLGRAGQRIWGKHQRDRQRGQTAR